MVFDAAEGNFPADERDDFKSLAWSKADLSTPSGQH